MQRQSYSNHNSSSNSYQHHWSDGSALEPATGKVVCVGRNYVDHIEEMQSAMPKQPVLFIKPATALCDANQAIKISHLEHLGAMHHELEIAVLIGEPYSPDQPTNCILGVGLGIDLTLRDVQTELKQQGLPWERSKAFDGSCALSGFLPYKSLSDHLKLELSDLELELQVNRQVRQRGNSRLMLYPIEQLLSEISECFTLEAGDVVLTGTPAGVGPLKPGDSLCGRLNEHQLIENIPVI